MTETYRDSYERQARDYVDHWRETGSNPWMPDELVHELDGATVEVIQRHVPPGSRVLDVGCAMGNLLARLSGYDAVGVDIAKPLVAVARSRGLTAKVGRAESLPFADGSFDAVVAVDIMEHVIDPNLVAAEMLRVVRPGGVVICRSPDSEDLAGYVEYWVYPFCHLRRWDDPSWRLFWRRIFGREVIDTRAVREELIVVVRA